MPRRVATPPVQPDDDLESRFAAHYPDNGAHHPQRWGRSKTLTAENPLYRDDAWSAMYGDIDRSVSEGRYDSARSEEFIPPWRTMSSQGQVNPDAIDHQVAHADPMRLREQPDVYAVQDAGEERYFVTEGNHRVLAAQRRGQLLMPANVERMV